MLDLLRISVSYNFYYCLYVSQVKASSNYVYSVYDSGKGTLLTLSVEHEIVDGYKLIIYPILIEMLF